MTKEIPEYRVNHERGYFNGHELIPNGTKVEHDGVPGDHLEPLNDAAHAAVKAHAKKGEGTSAPGRLLTSPDLNGPGGGGGGGDKDAEIARLKHDLAQAQGKLAKQGDDVVVEPFVEPASAGFVKPQETDTVSHTGAFMADVEGEAEAEGAEPKAAGRPRKS